MSLNYDFSKVDKQYWLDEENDEFTLVAQAMPWMAVAVGIGEITVNNYIDFYNRVHIFETLFTPFRHKTNDYGELEKVFLSLDEAKNFIGLHTNVSNETETKFRKRVFDNFYV